MAYQGTSGTGKLFAANNSGIFDATVAGAIGATVMALTDGWCSYTNFRTSGGSFLLVANGVDSLKSYDGTTWSSVASYTINGGGTLNGSDVINFAVHQRRLWLIKKDSTDVFYFDVNAATGNVTLFPLGGYAVKGGFVVAAYTWTVDGGAGPDDLIAFVFSSGQVIVYAGTDPSAVATWQLKGAYTLSRPLGRRCGLKLGGDVLLATEGGVFSLSDVLRGGKSVTQDLAISDLIRPEMSAATQLYGVNKGWQITGFLTKNLIFLNVPTTEASKSYQYGMNTISQGWWKNTGWDALCFEEFNNEFYGGFSTRVAKVWTGALDFTANVTGFARGHYDYLGERTREKKWSVIRPITRISGGVSLNMALDVDFEANADFGATTFGSSPGSKWDAATWDTSTWVGEQAPILEWQTVAAKPGYCAAVRLRAVSNGGTFSWSVTDLVFERGARVVG
jgi:hypothetical protein